MITKITASAVSLELDDLFTSKQEQVTLVEAFLLKQLVYSQLSGV